MKVRALFSPALKRNAAPRGALGLHARTRRRLESACVGRAVSARLLLMLVGGCAGAPTSFAQEAADDTATQAFPIASWSRTDALAEDLGTPAERGRAVFNNWCGACHGRDTRNAPGTRSLEFKYRGELPAAIEDRTDLTAEIVAFYVRNGVATMPFYRPTEISDVDLEALGAYLAE